MDPAACRVIYIDERFNTERWICRDGLTPHTPQRAGSEVEFSELPVDLQSNVNAFLTVFNQGKMPLQTPIDLDADRIFQSMYVAQEEPFPRNCPNSMTKSSSIVRLFSLVST